MKKPHTEEEIAKAKRILEESGYFGQLNFQKEDIIEKAKKMYPLSTLTENHIDDILLIADKTIENHETIWECYWLSIEAAIEDILGKDGLEK